MISSELAVSVVQDSLSWQDPAANRQRYESHFSSLKGSDLVVLPEMFSTGFSMNPWEAYETMNGETVQWMRQQAGQLQAVITGSLTMKLAEDVYVNRMIWARPDGEIQYYDKRHLFRYGQEHLHFKNGKEKVVLEHKGWRVALFVCYDLRFPVWSRNCDDYDLALYVANWPNSRQFAWDSLLVARAIENQAYVAACNRLGEDPLGNEFSGGSVILDFMGKPLAHFADELKTETCSLSMQGLQEFREHFPASLDTDKFEILD